MSTEILTLDEIRRQLAVRDLTDPETGPHAIQTLVKSVVDAIKDVWGCEVRWVRSNPIVSVANNYDRLRIPADAVSRDARYTRYVGRDVMLRSHSSAMLPQALRDVAASPSDDLLIVCPGIVYRRDAIDRLHTGTPHQLDLWRVRNGKRLTVDDLKDMIRRVVAALMPGRLHREVARPHPYTTHGRQVDVHSDGEWVEVSECGLVHRDVLIDSGLVGYTGLAMGLGLDRVLMLRKGIPDIRLLTSRDPRIARQMLDLKPYRPVSNHPPIRRDLSVAVAEEDDAEQLGDRVRSALGDETTSVESVQIVSQTPASNLPPAAVSRIGLRPGQKNVLVRIELSNVERTLTDDEANQLRDRIYAAIHQGTTHQWASEQHE